MSQFTSVNIDIDGKKIRQFSSISLSQSIFNHHRFRLVCPTEAIDGTSGTILNASKDLVGATFSLQINAIGNAGSLQFSGVVLQVEAERYSGHAGDIIISGNSPTILMDSGPHCKTWEKKSIKNIALDVLKHFPQNLLKPKISPLYGDLLSYTVQYKETGWQLLNRLCLSYGEWFFYNGQNLIMGFPEGNKIKLVYGSNLPQFNMALQMMPANFQMMAYDYMNSEVYDGNPKSIADKAGLDGFGKHTLQKSEQFYATQPKVWHNHFLTNKKQLDDIINTRASMQSSKMVRFNGCSGHPGIQLGGSVSIEGKNIFTQSDESFGDFTIISVNHVCDGQGNYSNDFEAIPASVKFPPMIHYSEPHCETQSAFVTDNNDPKGLGRIRVKFHWMNGIEKSPWLRVTTPHAGESKGMFMIPEIGEEVIIGFEGDSSTKPYVIGAVYHGKAKNSFANGGNDVKALQSRSGNKVLLNDKDGSLYVSDSKGNDLMMDGKGNINMKSSETIVFTCGKSKIELKKDGTINIEAGDDGVISLHGKEINITAKETINIKASDGKVETTAKNIKTIGQDEVLIGSSKKVTIDGGSNAKITSGKTEVL